MVRILQASGHRHMPWKNGRGETVEVAVFPEGASVDTFDWRISMATVSEDGAFSNFPDIDRTLSILDGKGMELRIKNRDPILLTQSSEPYAFPADEPTTASLPEGKITDLNIMTRRGLFSHTVTRISDTTKTVEPEGELVLVLCQHGRMHLSSDGKQETLDAYDCAILSKEERAQLSGAATGFVIRIREKM